MMVCNKEFHRVACNVECKKGDGLKEGDKRQFRLMCRWWTTVLERGRASRWGRVNRWRREGVGRARREIKVLELHLDRVVTEMAHWELLECG